MLTDVDNTEEIKNELVTHSLTSPLQLVHQSSNNGKGERRDKYI